MTMGRGSKDNKLATQKEKKLLHISTFLTLTLIFFAVIGLTWIIDTRNADRFLRFYQNNSGLFLSFILMAMLVISVSSHFLVLLILKMFNSKQPDGTVVNLKNDKIAIWSFNISVISLVFYIFPMCALIPPILPIISMMLGITSLSLQKIKKFQYARWIPALFGIKLSLISISLWIINWAFVDVGLFNPFPTPD